MAAGTVKTTLLKKQQGETATTRDDVFNNGEVGGFLRTQTVIHTTVHGTETNDVGDKIALMRLPKNAIVSNIRVVSEDLHSTSAGSYNLGIEDENGTVLDDDCFGAALTGVRTDSDTNIFPSVAKKAAISKTLEEIAALASKTVDGNFVVLVFEVAAAFDQSGDLIVKVDYTV